VDLLEVDAATNTKVDEMRELLETAQYAPVSGRYKVYIIDEVHMLSKSAFNAMLKTLEEPPAHVEFILATTDPQKLPITVLSRCLQFNLKNMPSAVLVEHLAKILTAENIVAEPQALQLLARAAEGSVRDSLSLLDQAIAYGAGEVKADQVATMLGALDQTYLFALLDCLVKNDAKALVAEIDNIAARSISFDITLKDFASVLARIALVQNVGAAAVVGPEAVQIVDVSTRLAADDVQLYYQIALLGRRDLSLAPDEHSGFMMTMLRMLSFGGAKGPGAAVSVGGAVGVMPKAVTPSMKAYATEGSNSSIGAARGDKLVQEPVLTSTSYLAKPVLPTGMSFNGDWPAFIAKLSFNGMAGMLAKQCEFQSFADGVLELTLPTAQKHLAEKAFQEKLKSELLPYFGVNFRLHIRIGDVAGKSLAAVEDRDRSARQVAAEAAILADPFINNLKQDFGAEVVASSIRPAST
jgi:DNA polymerase-3 subunit gamma/tau